jgi:hypothetical protein
MSVDEMLTYLATRRDLSEKQGSKHDGLHAVQRS